MKTHDNPTTALAGQNREEHTALPWQLHPTVMQTPPVIYGDGCEVATVATSSPNPGEQEANAEFIVRAVNSHDALVDALNELCQAFAHNIPHASQRPAYLQARAALALAGKGEK